MKTKYLWLGIGALLLTAGGWLARAAWRAHCQIVTLQVRNAPLGEVLGKIEKQTWKKIYAEQSLDARITLNVVNKPLAYVLDRLAEQAGAQWSTLYTVYESSRALAALQAALHGDGKLEPAGWTRLAPDLPKFNQPGELGYGPQPRQSFEVKKLPPDFVPGMAVTATDDTVVDTPSAGKTQMAATGPGAARQMPRAVHVVRKGPGDGAVEEEEVWTPEELVAETGLKARLDTPTPDDIPAAAVQLAQKLKAHWTTCIAFRKSAMGIGFGARPFRKFRRFGPGPQLNGTNGPGLLPPPDFAEAARHQGNEAFERLTPEQRVRRAREVSSQVRIEAQNAYENK